MKYYIIDTHVDGLCPYHPEIIASSEEEALKIHGVMYQTQETVQITSIKVQDE